MYDDAVNYRLNPRNRAEPFFGEKYLPKRARAVPGSLEIDTRHAVDRA